MNTKAPWRKRQSGDPEGLAPHNLGMGWSHPGLERAADDLGRALAAATWPEPPPGFVRVGKLRPMRQVLRGTLDTDAGTRDIALKWYRPASRTDRVRRSIGAHKSERECRVLRGLHEAGVRVPEPLIQMSAPAECLVTAWIPDLEALPTSATISKAQRDKVVALLAKAHAAGLDHRDLHTDNLGWAASQAVLVDLGRARLRRRALAATDAKTLARMRLGLLGAATRSQRLRALERWLHAHEAPANRPALHRLAREVEGQARILRRQFWRGRDRRTTRSGRHFHAYEEGPHRGIARTEAQVAWERASKWLVKPPAESVSLKAGGKVLRYDDPSLGTVVLKYYDATAGGRVPRAVRAFRKAEALQVRGLAAPRPLLAIAHREQGSLLVSAYVEAQDLHALMSADYDTWSLPDQRRLQRSLGRTLRQLHEAELHHRDLKAPNLLWHDTQGVVIADVDGLRRHKGPVGWSRRMRDLSRLDASLGARRTDRLRVFHAYLAAPPWRRPAKARLLERIAQGVRRKRGPTGRPR